MTKKRVANPHHERQPEVVRVDDGVLGDESSSHHWFPKERVDGIKFDRK